MPAGIAMALPMILVAGMLMFSGVQASDIADGSKNHGLLSKVMPLRSGSSKSSIGDNGKIIAHQFNNMKRGGRPEASSDHIDLVEEVPRKPTVDSPFMTYSDKPAHPTTPTQNTMEFAPVQAGAFRTSKDLEPQKIADKDDDKDVEKLFTNASSKPMGLSTIGVVLLLFTAMVRVRMRRGMQPAIALASSGRHGIDMSIPMAPVSVDSKLDLISSASRVGFPEQALQGSERALAMDMHTDSKSPFGVWDSFGLGEAAPEVHVENFRESTLQHGRAAMTAVFFTSPQKPRPMHTLMQMYEGNPRAAARARAVALVDKIGSKSELPDPPVLRTTALDWSAIAEGLHPAQSERDDEQRRSRASIEALATVAAALSRARIVDPCAGKGDVALPLAHFLNTEVLLCDVSGQALEKAAARAEEAGLDHISTRTVDCAKLGPHLREDDCIVALRACGAVTDMAIAAAVDKGAAFVVSPCCLWKAVAKLTTKGGRMPTTAPDEIAYPRSSWLADFDISAKDYSMLVDADDPPAARASAMLGDGSRTRLFRQARRILEEDRLRYASERGYAIRLLRFEGGDNPHVGILVGVRESADGAAAALAALPGDAFDDDEPLFP